MKLQKFLSIGFIFSCQLLVAETQANSIEQRRAAASGREMKNFNAASGKVYRDVVITRIDDGGISFRHATGTARLRYADLTPSQRERFGIDPADALATYKLEASLRDKYEKAVEKKEQQRAAEANEKYKAKLEAEKAARLALEQQQLSTPIPSNPPVKLSQAMIPQKSVTYRTRSHRTYSNDEYYPNYRPYCSPRNYRYGYGFSYRSPSFNIIIR